MAGKSKFPQIGDDAVTAQFVFSCLQRFFDGFFVATFFQKLFHLGYGELLTGINRHGG